ncbi:MAG: DNA primase [Methanomicrobiaceae archaeon]|nr:DNA primase [Methanomicrobiaceae archaeon]
MYSPETTKYLIHIYLEAEGVVEKSDVVGAIFGQTEGLLGEDLDLRDLQRTGRVGRIDVQTTSRKGETKGEILISSSLDKAETALLSASLETIDRVGPCNARVSVERIEDIRITKRRKILERAKEILLEHFDEGTINSNELLDLVREQTRIEKVGIVGEEKLPAGPNVMESDAIIVVEGRADVINLLRYGIKNAVAVEGTNVPDTIITLCETKTATAFLDGDRGGDLILSELLQTTDIDFVAFARRGRSVEAMSRKEIVKALRNKVPVEFIADVKREGEQEKPARRPIPPIVAVGEDVRGVSPEEGRETARTGEEPRTEVHTLRNHFTEVEGHHIARFLSPEYTVIRESRADDAEQEIPEIEGDVSGIVIDSVVDQRMLDLIAGKGMEYVAARDFTGIIKKPVSTRLLRII